MKKFSIMMLAFFSVACGSLSADVYSFAWNRCEQTLSCGSKVRFEHDNSERFELSDCGTKIEFRKSGDYVISYSLVGSAYFEGNHIPGEWTATLYLDCESVNGGDVTVANSEYSLLNAVGLAIIHAHRGDELSIAVCGYDNNDVLIKEATITIHELE